MFAYPEVRTCDTAAFVRWTARGAIGLAALGVFTAAQIPRKPAQLLEDVKAERLSLYAFLREMRNMDPAAFDKGLTESMTTGLRDSYRSEFADANVAEGRLLGVQDSGTALRSEFAYSGHATVDGVRLGFQGKALTFWHAGGVAALESLCFDAPDCDGASELMAAAEQNLQRRLEESRVQGILPEGGECSVDSLREPHYPTAADVHLCSYPRNVMLSFTRRNRGEAIAAFERLALQDPWLRSFFGR